VPRVGITNNWACYQLLSERQRGEDDKESLCSARDSPRKGRRHHPSADARNRRNHGCNNPSELGEIFGLYHSDNVIWAASVTIATRLSHCRAQSVAAASGFAMIVHCTLVWSRLQVMLKARRPHAALTELGENLAEIRDREAA